MSNVVKRWTAHLAVRTALLATARKRHEWQHNAQTRAVLEKRKAQVSFATRVLARHRQATTVDPGALQHVAPWLTPAQATDLGLALGPAFVRFQINTPLRCAHAVAQFAEESAGFKTTTEYASGDEYEGRHDLGNTVPGDGRRFKGRGYIQVTGRGNYTHESAFFHVDFTKHPELVAVPKWAALVSCHWWASHDLNRFADADNLFAITHRINGGYNGLSSRAAYLKRAKEVEARLVPR